MSYFTKINSPQCHNSQKSITHNVIIRRPLELAEGEPGVLGYVGQACAPGILDPGYLESSVLDLRFWVLDLGPLGSGSWIWDLGLEV